MAKEQSSLLCLAMAVELWRRLPDGFYCRARKGIKAQKLQCADIIREFGLLCSCRSAEPDYLVVFLVHQMFLRPAADIVFLTKHDSLTGAGHLMQKVKHSASPDTVRLYRDIIKDQRRDLTRLGQESNQRHSQQQINLFTRSFGRKRRASRNVPLASLTLTLSEIGVDACVRIAVISDAR